LSISSYRFFYHKEHKEREVVFLLFCLFCFVLFVIPAKAGIHSFFLLFLLLLNPDS